MMALLGITARGKYRYKIINSRIEPDDLITAILKLWKNQSLVIFLKN